jgi:hypothetical protein
MARQYNRSTRIAHTAVKPSRGSSVPISGLSADKAEQERLYEAAKIIAEAAKKLGATFSKRIPGSIEAVKTSTGKVFVTGGGPEAPNFYPMDPPPNVRGTPSGQGVRHPLWARGPRDKWHWGPTPYRPVLEQAVEIAGDRADDAFARVIDDWAKRIGKDRP